MLEMIPSEEELRAMVGEAFYAAAGEVRAFLAEHYTLEEVWGKGGKAAVYQCRYRRAGKTLCTLLYRSGEAACMIVFGAAEREKAEALTLSPVARERYRAATTFHDGKWVWFTLDSAAMIKDIQTLLPVKRRLMK